MKTLDLTLRGFTFYGLPHWAGPSLPPFTPPNNNILNLSGLHTLKLRMAYVVNMPSGTTAINCMMTTRDLFSLAILPRTRNARITKLELDLHEWMGPMTYYTINFIEPLLFSYPNVALSLQRLTITSPPACSIGQMVNEALYALKISDPDHHWFTALTSLHIVAKPVAGVRINHTENANGITTLFRYLLSPHPTGYLSHVKEIDLEGDIGSRWAVNRQHCCHRRVGSASYTAE